MPRYLCLMRQMPRFLTGLVLMLSLALTSAGAGYARGLPAAVGHAELCRGLVVVTVAVDGAGQPVSPLHLCADAIGLLFAASGAPEALRPPVTTWQSVPRRPFRLHPRALHSPGAQARGPPLQI